MLYIPQNHLHFIIKRIVKYKKQYAYTVTHLGINKDDYTFTHLRRCLSVKQILLLQKIIDKITKKKHYGYLYTTSFGHTESFFCLFYPSPTNAFVHHYKGKIVKNI